MFEEMVEEGEVEIVEDFLKHGLAEIQHFITVNVKNKEKRNQANCFLFFHGLN